MQRPSVDFPALSYDSKNFAVSDSEIDIIECPVIIVIYFSYMFQFNHGGLLPEIKKLSSKDESL